MTNIEQVEKLRQRANVTYDEAKAALEAAGGDLLDAMIELERQGKIKPPEGGGLYQSAPKEEKQEQARETDQGESFSSLVSRFFRWVRKLVHKGNINSFDVKRHEKSILTLPLTVLALLLFFAFWITIPLLIVGLFLGCRYRFCGPNFSENGVNQVMDSAAKAAENLKQEIKNAPKD